MSKIKAKWMVYVSPSQLKTRLSSVFVTIVGIWGGIFCVEKVITIVLGVGSGWIFKLVQTVSRDINKFIKWWNCYVLVGKVGDDSECSNRAVENWAIKFRDDVCATPVLQYDDVQTEISCTHFVIERLFDGGISDQDEITELQVIFDDGGSMLLFETDCGFDPCSIYIRGKHCQVWLMFLQGDSSPSNQVGQGKRGIRQRKKVSGFCWNGISWDVIPTWNRTFWQGIVSDHCTVKTCANDIILTVDW